MSEPQGPEAPSPGDHEFDEALRVMIDSAEQREELAKLSVELIARRLGRAEGIVDAFSSLQANEFKSPATAEYYSGLVSHISDRVAGVDTSTYRIVSIPYDSLDQEKVARFRHQTVDGKTTSMKVDFYGNRPVELRPWHFLEEEAEDGSARVFVDHGRLSADLGREIDDPQMAHLTKALELMLEET